VVVRNREFHFQTVTRRHSNLYRVLLLMMLDIYSRTIICQDSMVAVIYGYITFPLPVFLLSLFLLVYIHSNLVDMLREHRGGFLHIEQCGLDELWRLLQRIQPRLQIGSRISFQMLRHAISLSGQRSRQFCHQFLACILCRAEGSGLDAVQLSLRTRGVSHLMEKVRVERLPVLELPFFRHHNLVLADGEIGGIAKHGFDGTYPTVVRYHPIHGFKGKLLVLLYLGHRVFLFQFLPKLWSDLLQVGLRHIEDMVSLKLWIDIVFLLLIAR